MSALNEYYAALERLKANKPIVLPKGSAINNDTVAMEAGRKRGSIKKSRHAALIEAIEQAAQAVFCLICLALAMPTPPFCIKKTYSNPQVLFFI